MGFRMTARGLVVVVKKINIKKIQTNDLSLVIYKPMMHFLYVRLFDPDQESMSNEHQEVIFVTALIAIWSVAL